MGSDTLFFPFSVYKIPNRNWATKVFTISPSVQNKNIWLKFLGFQGRYVYEIKVVAEEMQKPIYTKQ